MLQHTTNCLQHRQNIVSINANQVNRPCVTVVRPLRNVVVQAETENAQVLETPGLRRPQPFKPKPAQEPEKPPTPEPKPEKVQGMHVKRSLWSSIRVQYAIIHELMLSEEAQFVHEQIVRLDGRGKADFMILEKCCYAAPERQQNGSGQGRRQSGSGGRQGSQSGGGK